MDFVIEYKSKIFSVNEKSFNQFALELFYYQAINNPVYQKYLKIIGKDVLKINRIEDIPFMPVSFFKYHKILCKPYSYETIFLSSGTTGIVQSKHYVADIELYKSSFINTFSAFFGDIKEYVFLGLLPSYIERKNSSLVFMVQELMKISNKIENGFYINDYKNLSQKLKLLDSFGKKIILFGVSFALMDFAKQFPTQLKNTVVIETGGMKGREKEITRDEMHDFLCKQLGLNHICSEYGMSELLSQAYSLGKGVFYSPPWMKILISEQNDPFEFVKDGESGVINIIDLANIYSCAFLKTQDLGRCLPSGGFEVLGRADGSDLRGCNLMI